MLQVRFTLSELKYTVATTMIHLQYLACRDAILI